MSLVRGRWEGLGPQEEVLRLLSERLTHISGRLYGGVYGFGYGGVTESELGDILRQMSAIMWIFPEYNPMIKQLVSIRPNYVFGQGFDVAGESKRRKREKMKLIHQKREEMRVLKPAAGTGDGYHGRRARRSRWGSGESWSWSTPRL